MRPVCENVGGHEDGVGEQADAGFDALVHLLLVGNGPLQEAHVGNGRQNPRQLGDLRHVRLSKKGGAFGIETAGQKVQRDSP